MIGSIAAFENKASIGYSAAKSVLLNYNKNLAINFSDHNVVSKLIILDLSCRQEARWKD